MKRKQRSSAQTVGSEVPEASGVLAPQEKSPPPFLAVSLTCVPTNQPFITTVESIHNAASGAGRWHRKEKQPPYYVRQTEKNTTFIEYGRDGESQVFDDRAILNLWQDVKAFSDRDVDLLLFVFSAIIQQTNGQGGAWIWASQFLDQRGVKPITKRVGTVSRRAGHRIEDILDLDDSFYRLSGLWITIEETFPARRKGGKPRVYRHKGRVITVMETWSQETLTSDDQGRERLPIAWKIRAGDWLLEYLKAPRYVAHLCDQSLKYDPYHELWEKRLSRYLLFFLHINSRQSQCIMVRSIRELLLSTSLPLDSKNPRQKRDRFEKAMN